MHSGRGGTTGALAIAAVLGIVSTSAAPAMPPPVQDAAPRLHVDTRQLSWHTEPNSSVRHQRLVGPEAGAIPRGDLRIHRLVLASGLGAVGLSHRVPEIHFIAAGAATWTIGNEHFTAMPGTAIYVPPGATHTFIATGLDDLIAIAYRWATGGNQEALHASSTMTDDVPDYSSRPTALGLTRYQAAAEANDRLYVRSDDVAWTTNWTYPESLWRVYRYKPLVRSALANWPGVIRADVRMGLQVLDAGAAYPTHFHPSPEVYVVLDGRARWIVDGRAIDAGPGTAIHTPPNARHRIENAEEGPLRWLYFWWAPNGDSGAFDPGP